MRLSGTVEDRCHFQLHPHPQIPHAPQYTCCWFAVSMHPPRSVLPLLRKRSRAAANASLTNALLPITAPSVKYLTRQRNIAASFKSGNTVSFSPRFHASKVVATVCDRPAGKPPPPSRSCVPAPAPSAAGTTAKLRPTALHRIPRPGHKNTPAPALLGISFRFPSFPRPSLPHSCSNGNPPDPPPSRPAPDSSRCKPPSSALRCRFPRSRS